MEKVVISKFLADRIVKYEREFDERVANDECIEEFVIGEILSDCYLKDDLKISLVTLARAIEEGYEVEKEYLTLEQVVELPDGTIVNHDNLKFNHVVRQCWNDTLLLLPNTTVPMLFSKRYLEPKWYIVK